METFQRSIVIDAPIHEVFHFHDTTCNLVRITPWHTSVTVESEGVPGVGNEIIIRTRHFGLFTMRWHVRFTEYDPPFTLTDEQVSGPFTLWTQTRHFENVPGGTRLTDIVRWRAPFKWLLRPVISRMFKHRQQVTKELLESGSLERA